MAERKTPITPEQALVGSVAEFGQFFDQLRDTYWPGLPVALIDKRFLPSDNVPLARQNFMALAERYPAADGKTAPPAVMERVITEAGRLMRGRLGASDAGLVLPMGNDPMTFDMRAMPELPQVVVVGVDGNACSHCTAPRERNPALSCDNPTSPAAIRLSQLGRMTMGLHEYAHGLEMTLGLGDVMARQAAAAGITLSGSNSRESLSDSWSALMMVHLYGAEGRAAVAGMLANRTAPGLKASHQTVSTLEATLAYIDSRPAEVAAMSPKELLTVAVGLAAQHSLSLSAEQALNSGQQKRQERPELVDMGRLALSQALGTDTDNLPKPSAASCRKPDGLKLQ